MCTLGLGVLQVLTVCTWPQGYFLHAMCTWVCCDVHKGSMLVLRGAINLCMSGGFPWRTRVVYNCSKTGCPGNNKCCPYQPHGWGGFCWLVWWSKLQPSARRACFEVLLTNMFDTCTSTHARVSFKGEATNCSSLWSKGTCWWAQRLLHVPVTPEQWINIYFMQPDCLLHFQGN